MIRSSVTALLLFAALAVAQPKPSPQPRAVDPGDAKRAPSDAMVLFDGRSVSEWVKRDGSPTGCSVNNGEMWCVTGAGDAISKAKFGSAQIHLEFSIPSMPEQKGQLRGNSGVYLQSRYEIQILDSYKNETYANGHCAALYGQAPPLVLASRPPEQWQSYDIVFHAAKCDGAGNVEKPATVTLFHNGVLVQDNVVIQKSAESRACQPGPLLLQDHSGFKGAPNTVMKFRNIWLRPLTD